MGADATCPLGTDPIYDINGELITDAAGAPICTGDVIDLSTIKPESIVVNGFTGTGTDMFYVVECSDGLSGDCQVIEEESSVLSNSQQLLYGPTDSITSTSNTLSSQEFVVMQQERIRLQLLVTQAEALSGYDARDLLMEAARGYAELGDKRTAALVGYQAYEIKNGLGNRDREDVARWARSADLYHIAYKLYKEGEEIFDLEEFLADDDPDNKWLRKMLTDLDEWTDAAQRLIDAGYYSDALAVLEYAEHINEGDVNPDNGACLFFCPYTEPEENISDEIRRLQAIAEEGPSLVEAPMLSDLPLLEDLPADSAVDATTTFTMEYLQGEALARLEVLESFQTTSNLSALTDRAVELITVGYISLQQGDLEQAWIQLDEGFRLYDGLIRYREAESKYVATMNFFAASLPTNGTFPSGNFNSLGELADACEGDRYYANFSGNVLYDQYSAADETIVAAVDALWYFNTNKSPANNRGPIPQTLADLNAVTAQYETLAQSPEVVAFVQSVQEVQGQDYLEQLADEPAFADRVALGTSIEKLTVMLAVQEQLGSDQLEWNEESLNQVRAELVNLAMTYGEDGEAIVATLQGLNFSDAAQHEVGKTQLIQSIEDIAKLEKAQALDLLDANIEHIEEMDTDDEDPLKQIASDVADVRGSCATLSAYLDDVQRLAEDLTLETQDRTAYSMLQMTEEQLKPVAEMWSTINAGVTLGGLLPDRELDGTNAHDAYISRLEDVRDTIATIRNLSPTRYNAAERRAELIQDVNAEFNLLVGPQHQAYFAEYAEDATYFNLAVGAAVIVGSMIVGGWIGGIAKAGAMTMGAPRMVASAIGFIANISAFTTTELILMPGQQLWDSNLSTGDNVTKFLGRFGHNAVIVGTLGGTLKLVNRGAESVILARAESQLISEGAIVAGEGYSIEMATLLFERAATIRATWTATGLVYGTSFAAEGTVFMALNTGEAVYQHGLSKGLDQSLFSEQAWRMNFLNLLLIKTMHRGVTYYASAGMGSGHTLPSSFDANLKTIDRIESNITIRREEAMQLLESGNLTNKDALTSYRDALVERQGFLDGMGNGRNEVLLAETVSEIRMINSAIHHYEIFGPNNAFGLTRDASVLMPGGVEAPIFTYKMDQAEAMRAMFEQMDGAQLVLDKNGEIIVRYKEPFTGETSEILFRPEQVGEVTKKVTDSQVVTKADGSSSTGKSPIKISLADYPGLLMTSDGRDMLRVNLHKGEVTLSNEKCDWTGHPWELHLSLATTGEVTLKANSGNVAIRRKGELEFASITQGNEVKLNVGDTLRLGGMEWVWQGESYLDASRPKVQTDAFTSSHWWQVNQVNHFVRFFQDGAEIQTLSRMAADPKWSANVQTFLQGNIRLQAQLWRYQGLEAKFSELRSDYDAASGNPSLQETLRSEMITLRSEMKSSWEQVMQFYGRNLTGKHNVMIIEYLARVESAHSDINPVKLALAQSSIQSDGLSYRVIAETPESFMTTATLPKEKNANRFDRIATDDLIRVEVQASNEAAIETFKQNLTEAGISYSELTIGDQGALLLSFQGKEKGEMVNLEVMFVESLSIDHIADPVVYRDMLVDALADQNIFSTFDLTAPLSKSEARTLAHFLVKEHGITTEQLHRLAGDEWVQLAREDLGTSGSSHQAGGNETLATESVIVGAEVLVNQGNFHEASTVELSGQKVFVAEALSPELRPTTEVTVNVFGQVSLFTPRPLVEYLPLRIVEDPMTVFTRNVESAESLVALREVIATSPIEQIGNLSRERLVLKLDRVIAGEDLSLLKLPVEGGVLQAVRSLYEQNLYSGYTGYESSQNWVVPSEAVATRLAETAQRTNGSTIDPIALYEQIGTLRTKLIERLSSDEMIDAVSDYYTRDEFLAIIHQVVDQGRPLALLTRTGDARRLVKEYQNEILNITAFELFPMEMQLSNDRVINFFSGERVSSAEAAYRMALDLLYLNAGSKSLSMPTTRDVQALTTLLQTHIDPTLEAGDYAACQQALRTAMESQDPKVWTLFGEASASERALLQEAYFGAFTRREVDFEAAIFIQRVFGEVGMFREVGMVLVEGADGLKVELVFGRMNSVSDISGREALMLHTHPIKFLEHDGIDWAAHEPDGELGMGTVVLESNRQDASNYNAIFSESDMSAFMELGPTYLRNIDTSVSTPLWDASTRSYYNWVLSPRGGSEIQIRFNEQLQAENVIIRYSPDDPSSFDYVMRIQTLTEYAAKEFPGLPIQFEPISHQVLTSRIGHWERPLQ